MREDKYCEGYIPWITKITPVPKPYTFADALADIGEEYLRAAKMYKRLWGITAHRIENGKWYIKEDC